MEWLNSTSKVCKINGKYFIKLGRTLGDSPFLAAKTGNPGYQEFGLAGVVPAGVSGLLALTQYYFTADIDGAGALEFTFTTVGAPTYADLLILVNAALDVPTGLIAFSTLATIAIEGADLRITSLTTHGPGSTVAITVGTTGADMLAALAGFIAMDAAVGGTLDAVSLQDDLIQAMINDTNDPIFALFMDLNIYSEDANAANLLITLKFPLAFSVTTMTNGVAAQNDGSFGPFYLAVGKVYELGRNLSLMPVLVRLNDGSIILHSRNSHATADVWFNILWDVLFLQEISKTVYAEMGGRD